MNKLRKLDKRIAKLEARRRKLIAVPDPIFTDADGKTWMTVTVGGKTAHYRIDTPRRVE